MMPDRLPLGESEFVMNQWTEGAWRASNTRRARVTRVTVTEGTANLKATLQTPKGLVVLESLGI